MFTFKKYDNQMVFLQFFFFIFVKHNWHKLTRKAVMFKHSTILTALIWEWTILEIDC